MLFKSVLLAGALTATLASAHVEEYKGEGHVVTINTPSTTHKHILHDKVDKLHDKLNMTKPWHKDDKGKHDHGKGVGKLHGGPAKFNQTRWGNEAPKGDAHQHNDARDEHKQKNAHKQKSHKHKGDHKNKGQHDLSGQQKPGHMMKSGHMMKGETHPAQGNGQQHQQHHARHEQHGHGPKNETEHHGKHGHGPKNGTEHQGKHDHHKGDREKNGEHKMPNGHNMKGKIHGGPEKFNGTEDTGNKHKAILPRHEDGRHTMPDGKTMKGMHGGHGPEKSNGTEGAGHEHKHKGDKNKGEHKNMNKGEHPNKGEHKMPDGQKMKGKMHGGPDKFNGTENTGNKHKAILPRQGPPAGGNAFMANRCDYDIWMWSVEEGYSSEAIHVPARTRYSEPKRSPANGGVVFKVSRSDQLMGGQQTQFEYATHDNVIYYDISFVDCATGNTAQNCPGWDMGLKIDSPEPACGKVNCAANSYCTDAAYFVDTPLQKLGIAEPVFGCGGAGVGMDLYFITCGDAAPLSKRELTRKSVAGRISME